MINRFFIAALVTVSFFLVTYSCSSEDATIDIGVKINEIKGDVASGTWRITSFIDSGNNETGDFTGYNFTFNENGTLSASNGTDTVTGS